MSSTQNVTNETKWKIANILTEQYDLEKDTKSKKNTSNSACYVATMVYEDNDHPKVQILRNFRDTTIRKYFFGNLLIKFYYVTSPSFVKYVEGKSYLKAFIKVIVDRIVDSVK